LAAAGYEAWLRDKPQVLAFDTETTGLAWWDEAFCVTVAWEGEAHFFDLSVEAASTYLAVMLCETPTLVGHNTKFDLQKVLLAKIIQRADLWPEKIEDTWAMAHLLDEHRSKKLKDLARTELGIETTEDEDLKVIRRKLKLKKSDGYHVLPRGILVPYAIADADMTFKLWHRLKAQLETFPDLVNLYRLEMDLTLVLLDMEARGMGVNRPYVESKVKEYGGLILKTQSAISEIVGRPIGKEDGQFNPASVPQIKVAFRDLRGLDVEGTSESVLKEIDDPLAAALVELRKYSKLRSTYMIPILEETRGGIIHTSFRQHGTVTGRFSSGSNQTG
jgi:DNA polymerase-1